MNRIIRSFLWELFRFFMAKLPRDCLTRCSVAKDERALELQMEPFVHAALYFFGRFRVFRGCWFPEYFPKCCSAGVLPFVRGGLRWGRVVLMATSFKVEPTYVHSTYLPPLAPPYKGGELSKTLSTPILLMLNPEAPFFGTFFLLNGPGTV